MTEFPELRTEAEAAEFLRGLLGYGAATTLRKLRCVGGGPAFHRVGRSIRYLETDLRLWARQQIGGPVRSTAEYRQKRAS